MEVTKINTRFMQGNKTDEVFDELVGFYGIGAVCGDDIDFSEAIFSNGFIRSMEQGMIPILGSQNLSHERKDEREYHHFILGDDCYVIYFQEKDS